MDYEKLVKIKKIALYFFSGVGALALFWIVFSNFFRFQPLNLSGYGVASPSGYERGGIRNIKTEGLEALADLFSEESLQAVNPASLTRADSEGQLTKRKITKTGSISLLVKKAEEIALNIKFIAERLNGFVIDSQIYEVSDGVKSGNVTIRVPSERFDEAFSEIKKIALKVENESVNSQDVTEQFIDLEARLKNLKAEETQYLKIMERAYNVKDTLEVASRLSDVRGRVEQIQGQLQYLSRQVDMSTISILLTAEADVEVFGLRWRPLFIIKQSFRGLVEGLTGYADQIISWIFYLPVLILQITTFALIIVFGWKFLRWFKRKFFG